MNEIFLSASVPIVGRGNYHETADPFLIQFAVKEFVTSIIRDFRVVWSGHPAITPMVLEICRDLGVNYSDAVILYQSRFFENLFPMENRSFNNIILTDAVPEDREASLLKMREAMLSRPNLKAAVFIGGMQGVEEEFDIFRRFHPSATVLPVPSPGGAARSLAIKLRIFDEAALEDIDFVSLFQTKLLAQIITER